VSPYLGARCDFSCIGTRSVSVLQCICLASQYFVYWWSGILQTLNENIFDENEDSHLDVVIREEALYACNKRDFLQHDSARGVQNVAAALVILAVFFGSLESWLTSDGSLRYQLHISILYMFISYSVVIRNALLQ
jgi:hypothetical protein